MTRTVWCALFLLIAVGSMGPYASAVAVARPAQVAPRVCEVSGTIVDASGRAIENAVIEAVGTGVSRVLSDANGKYKFYVVGQRNHFSLKISREGYETTSSQPVAPKDKISFDAQLRRSGPVAVEMTRFVSGVSVSGKVTGLSREETGTHKVLVYVLTDRWYIHPFAENVDGRGYASIKADGSWRIDTKNRRHNPFKIAFVVVPEDYVPPAAIRIGDDADAAILAKFGAKNRAHKIEKAPKGL